MLTPRQRAAYDFITRFSERKGYAPSFDEIRRHLRLASLNAVAKLVAQLRRRGYLVEAPPNAKRWLAVVPGRVVASGRDRVTAPGRESAADRTAPPLETRVSRSTRPEPATLPLLGTIAAGRPIEAFETPEEIEVPASFLGSAGGGQRYSLLVRGDSMIEDGIQDGDVVVVRSARRAENGQTVVAVVDGEATLKRFHRVEPGAGPWVELRPANAAMKPFRVPAERVEIRGVLVGLLRRY